MPGVQIAFSAGSGLFPGSHVRQLPYCGRFDFDGARHWLLAVTRLGYERGLAVNSHTMLLAFRAGSFSLFAYRLDLF